MSSEGPSHKPAAYSFAQQTDNSCHNIPYINLAILQQLRSTSLENHKDLDLDKDAHWYNKRQWLAQTFLWTKEWELAMKRAIDTPFGEYQKAMLKEGIISGHVYDKNGNAYNNTYNPIENYARTQMVPFNFTDASTLPVDMGFKHVDSAFTTLPLFWHEGKAIAYDPDQQDYNQLTEVNSQEDIDNGNWDIALGIVPESTMVRENATVVNEAPSTHSSWQRTFGEYVESIKDTSESIARQFVSSPLYSSSPSFQTDLGPYFPTSKQHYRFYRLSPSQKAYFSLPTHTNLFYTTDSRLGYEIGFKYRYLPAESEQHSYYQSSLLQLMLLCMGIDNQNKPIDHDHPLFEAHIALKTEMKRSPHNPWALPSFEKENLLEYQIAKMIQADPLLKEKMKETAHIFFPSWQYYQDLKQCYDSPDVATRKPLKDKMDWLLGEDLYLAYVYVMNARFLWAAATSREAFNAVLDLDPALARILQLPFAPGPNSLIRNAQRKGANGFSFLDVWQQIQGNLVVNPEIPKELASFSGHGIVISLYNDLYEQQRERVHNEDVMKCLGFSVIDSYYGEQLNPMYRQHKETSQEKCDLEKLTEVKTTQRRHRLR
ncbi:hypothetical protein [Candidatus Berkiella aquae]|uniref:Uncharacterized protein n=1 Tax=Candidatus Berkiella aquae TaxID=295108 RepID=A0A0Q9YKY6_9GAMM|nr:hypothetical protein [Candidatus Berkiella aquae]MCS5710957.1 hypothetical protein [Candidatus Berkiella aquae]